MGTPGVILKISLEQLISIANKRIAKLEQRDFERQKELEELRICKEREP